MKDSFLIIQAAARVLVTITMKVVAWTTNKMFVNADFLDMKFRPEGNLKY